MKYTAPLLSLIFVLSACSSPNNDERAAPLSDETPVDLRVTSEIETGIKAAAITVMPNDAAQWVSQVVMIDENGDLYQTGLEERKARRVEGAKATHIAGIMRRGAAGLVLSITPAGGFGAFIESDNEGTLAPLPISAPDMNPESFCLSEAAPEERIYVRTEYGAQGFDILVTDNEAVTLTAVDKPLENCPKITALFAYNDAAYALPLRDMDGRGITITDGITIPGASELAAAYVTTDNLGGPFNKGAVLAADAQSERLVIISLDFANRTLSPPAN